MIKKITFLLLMLTSSLGFSQFSFDFSATTADNWIGDAGLGSVSTTSDSPAVNGAIGVVNSSATGQDWQNAQILPQIGDNKMDLSGTDKTVTFEYYSNETGGGMIKLEGSGATTMELYFPYSNINTWETISLDFSNADGQYEKFIYFPHYGSDLAYDGDNMPKNDTKISYFDDVSAPLGDVIEAPDPKVLPFDFETTPVTSDITGFDGGSGTVVDNPQATGNSSSKVMKIVRDGGQAWAGVFLLLDDNLDFSTNESIRFKVYTSAPIGTKIAFKLEGTGSKEIAAYTTVTEAWETLTYDFSGEPADYNKLVFLCDLGNTGDGSATSTFYIDDVVQYDASVAGPDLTLSDLTQDGSTITGFDAATSTYNIELAEGTTTVPTVAATASDTNATVQVTDATSLPGTTTILVTAADETFTNTITVNFSVAASEVYATDPTADANNVLSIFGSTYGNLAGTDFDPNWGQNTNAVAGDEYVLNNLNYQGVQFGSVQDVSGYRYLHIDYYSDDSTELNVSLISTGTGEETAYVLDMSTTGAWNSVDIPLTAFTAVDLTDVHQMKFEGNGTIRLDNIYFIETAPNPTANTSDVLSIFGGTYGNLAGTDFDPNWGQATDAVAGDEYVLNNLNYQGVQFSSSQDVSEYEFLHIDYYSDDSTELNLYLISTGTGGETAYALDMSTTGQWNSVDISLTEFTGVDLSIVDQMKFDGNGTIRLDNMYFLDSAPEPTHLSSNVLSIFGTTYGNLAGTDFDPNWGQATDAVAGDEYVLNNLSYQGVALGSAQDVTDYDYLHIDYKSDDSTELNLYLISTGTGGETAYALDMSTTGQWNSVDISLTEFTGVDLSIVDQMKFDGNGTIRLDNIYFGKELATDASLSDLTIDGSTIANFDASTSSYSVELPTSTTVVPTVAATATDTNASVVITDATSIPGTTTIVVTAEDDATTNTITINFYLGVADPTADTGDVLSVFGTTYGNLAGTDFDPDWGQSTDAVAGDEYVLNNLNYQGVQFSSSQDVSEYEFLHIDYYSDDSTELNLYLISTGTGGETAYALDMSTTGQWNSVDISLTEFTGVDLSIVDQMKFDGNGTIRLDNIYFLNDATASVGNVEAEKVRVAPNPTTGLINVTGDIYNTSGQLVLKNSNDLSGLPSGLYFVRVITNGSVSTSKVVKR